MSGNGGECVKGAMWHSPTKQCTFWLVISGSPCCCLQESGSHRTTVFAASRCRLATLEAERRRKEEERRRLAELDRLCQEELRRLEVRGTYNVFSGTPNLKKYIYVLCFTSWTNSNGKS